MLNPLALIDVCQRCYDRADYTAGPDGRDGATVTRIRGEMVLIFRGTLTGGRTLAERAAFYLDWLNDLRAELVYREHYPGLVHAGFAAAIDNLWPLLPYFRGPLTICGHSKGGALAVLMALRLVASQGLRARVVTFGAPKVGNDQLAQAAGDVLDIDRYENPHDLVPRLPPVDYAPCGYLVAPPAMWTAPRGVQENHSLETGYRPWIAAIHPPPAEAA